MTGDEKKASVGIAVEPETVKRSGQFYQCMGFVGFKSIEELCLYADEKGYWIASNAKGAISPEEMEARVDAGESLQVILGLNMQNIMHLEFVTPAEADRRIRDQIMGLDSIRRDLKQRTRIYYGEPEPQRKSHNPLIKHEFKEVSREASLPEGEKVEFETVNPLDS